MTTSAAPTTDAGPASVDDVLQQAENGKAKLAELGTRAAEARGEAYDGTLTAKMLVALTEMLYEPTPREYVKHIPATTGKPYASTGLNSTQWQIDVMNVVIGVAHWRVLAHYPAEGMCKATIIVGNDLIAARLDENGDVVPGEAQILASHTGWGAVKNGTTKGDFYKGAETNALKRVFARFGPGADVYRLEFEDENLGGVGSATAAGSQPAAPAQSAGQRQQPRIASERQQNMLRAKARNAGIDDMALANLILQLAGSPVRQYASLQEAGAYLNQLMAALPGDYVDPVVQAITNYQQSQAAAAHAAAQAATARATAQAQAQAQPGAPDPAAAAAFVASQAGSDVPASLEDLHGANVVEMAPVALSGGAPAAAA